MSVGLDFKVGCRKELYENGALQCIRSEYARLGTASPIYCLSPAFPFALQGRKQIGMGQNAT